MSSYAWDESGMVLGADIGSFGAANGPGDGPTGASAGNRTQMAISRPILGFRKSYESAMLPKHSTFMICNKKVGLEKKLLVP